MQNNKVGSMIRRLRLDRKMTQKQLAEKMNISDKAISKWECESGNPDVSLLLKLSNILGVDVHELLAGYEKRQINSKKDGDSLVGKLSKKDLKDQYKNRVVIGGVYCVKCSDSGNRWTRATTDMQGSKNRFAFSVSINSCPEPCMAEAWKQFGAAAFSFEVLEEIKKKETQTAREFSEDVKTLLELWTEKRNIE